MTTRRLTAAMAIFAVVALAGFARAAETGDKAAPGADALAVEKAQDRGPFDIVTLMVPMRDGIKLAADVYFPKGKKMKRPVILIRTPYGRVRMGAMVAPFLQGKNFVWVIQDTRGRSGSEGISSSFIDDAIDGYETVEWIAQQPWSNGKVGTAGISAMGITQYVMDKLAPPHLVCQHVMAAPASLYHTAAYQGGALKRNLVYGWLVGNDFPLHVVKLMVSMVDYNGLWEMADLTPDFDKVKIPIMHMAGWYDMFLQGNIDAFTGIREKGDPAARARQRLVIGPWTHMGFLGLAGTTQGDLAYPSNSMYSIYDMQGWFEECLLDRDKGFLSGPPIRYYVMGDVDDKNAPGNKWTTSYTWPPHDNMVPFYFHKDGLLSADKPAGADSVTIVDDPSNPVPTLGGANLMLKAGPVDQRPIENRPDVLVFSTPVLEEPVEITGQVKAKIYFSVDAADTDITVRLTDVYPDGRSMLLTDSAVRASHRESDRYRVPLKPGEPYEVTVDLWATSIVINKGHRIRAIISGTNFPRFDVNMHTGQYLDLQPNEIENAMKSGLNEYIKKPDLAPDARPANLTLFVSADRPSSIILPVVAKQ